MDNRNLEGLWSRWGGGVLGSDATTLHFETMQTGPAMSVNAASGQVLQFRDMNVNQAVAPPPGAKRSTLSGLHDRNGSDASSEGKLTTDSNNAAGCAALDDFHGGRFGHASPASLSSTTDGGGMSSLGHSSERSGTAQRLVHDETDDDRFPLCAAGVAASAAATVGGIQPAALLSNPAHSPGSIVSTANSTRAPALCEHPSVPSRQHQAASQFMTPKDNQSIPRQGARATVGSGRLLSFADDDGPSPGAWTSRMIEALMESPMQQQQQQQHVEPPQQHQYPAAFGAPKAAAAPTPAFALKPSSVSHVPSRQPVGPAAGPLSPTALSAAAATTASPTGTLPPAAGTSPTAASAASAATAGRVVPPLLQPHGFYPAPRVSVGAAIGPAAVGALTPPPDGARASPASDTGGSLPGSPAFPLAPASTAGVPRAARSGTFPNGGAPSVPPTRTAPSPPLDGLRSGGSSVGGSPPQGAVALPSTALAFQTLLPTLSGGGAAAAPTTTAGASTVACGGFGGGSSPLGTSLDLIAVLEFKLDRRLRFRVRRDIGLKAGQYAVVAFGTVKNKDGSNVVDVGLCVGTWSFAERSTMPRGCGYQEVGVVLRAAAPADCAFINDELPKMEENALVQFQHLAHFLHLPFDAVDAEFQFDQKLVRLFYTLSPAASDTTKIPDISRLQRELSVRLKVRVAVEQHKTAQQKSAIAYLRAQEKFNVQGGSA